jgi:hypothetical protein
MVSFAEAFFLWRTAALDFLDTLVLEESFLDAVVGACGSRVCTTAALDFLDAFVLEEDLLEAVVGGGGSRVCDLAV